ncbi:MAG TPA: gliding motility protein GldM [Bacteroidales bacterium]|nr:gliding motility protein GldM [Bacteroidales bacterium]
MGHGKETPRQKMIGMMYLVLTAMLALNVSAEVLEAFGAVDEGLKKTTVNYTEKNIVLYNDFNEQFAQNENKVRPWKEKADEVKKRSDELYEYIQLLKQEIVVANGQGKEDGAIAEDGEIINEKLLGKDKSDNPSMVLLGGNRDGKAYELRQKIKDYKEYLVSLVKDEDVRILHSLESSLGTENPPPAKDGTERSWEVKYFESMPLAAVMPLLTKLQVDVRNSESEVVQYLLDQINAGSLPFNKLEPTVIPNTNYVLEGNPYKADVFLAAVDTLNFPIVLVGRYDSVKLEDGSYDYEMVGNYDSLEIVDGKGKYSSLASRLGKQDWGGLIKLKKPDGSFITKTFKRNYTVAKPNLVVSPTKMNVFYVGVDNPVSISIAGIAGDKIEPSITNGKIQKQGDGDYIVNVNRPGNSLITVVANIDGTRKSMGTASFRVKALPDPVVKVAGKQGGKIEKNVLNAQAGVFAVMDNFDFELEFKIIEFSVSTTDKGGYYIVQKATGNKFTSGQFNLLKDVQRGRRVNIEDVKAVGPDGSVRPLASIVFEII